MPDHRSHEHQSNDVPDNGYERPRRITHVGLPDQGKKDLIGAVPSGDVPDRESYKHQIDDDVTDNGNERRINYVQDQGDEGL